MFYPTDDLYDGEIRLQLRRTDEAKPEKKWVPAYHFDICLMDGTKVGTCDLRIGHNEKTYIGGNIGYAVDEAYRGHRYAAKAVRLLFLLARRHEMQYLIITCDPANKASSRTCELAGGCYLETAAIPEDNEMYAAGKRYAMVYRFDLAEPCPSSHINDRAAVKEQYATSEKLASRISIHSKYSVNRQGFGNWIASHYDIRPGMSVLELGCGTGESWLGREDVISSCARFVLSDISSGMLSAAKETLKEFRNIEYRVIDIQDIPFDDKEFDVVIANMMLYHVPDLQTGLREVKRVMKDGGAFYCATYGENGMMSYICDLFRGYGIKKQTNGAFTLQNGEEKLKGVFREVRRFFYEDALEVTDAEDMVDYIRSLTDMSGLEELTCDELRKVLTANMSGGVLRVPKEYGMFIAG
ncbi:MAG: GNAT family N-acetyltransferase [Clostridia bacterium]|nr:GNAT family N-acetyltransferase [Clostridia bacterium]